MQKLLLFIDKASTFVRPHVLVVHRRAHAAHLLGGLLPVCPGQSPRLGVRRDDHDLIVTDLTMPGIDGFGLVEELKLDPRTKDIPVVVVSAKDITPEERKRLNGHIEAVYQKGSLPPRRFVDEVVQVLEDKSTE